MVCVSEQKQDLMEVLETRTDRSISVTDANKFYTVWYGGLSGVPGQVNGTTAANFAYNDDATIKFEPIQHSAGFYVVTADYTHADAGEGVLNINFYANGVKQGNTLTLGASNNSSIKKSQQASQQLVIIEMEPGVITQVLFQELIQEENLLLEIEDTLLVVFLLILCIIVIHK